jgi:hypothetical protein
MNIPLRLPPGQLSALRFEDVQLYLASRGWQLDAAASEPGAGVYRLPGEPDAEVLLPLRRDWADYAQRMADALATLAAVEQRSLGEVLADLAGPPGDVIRLRLRSGAATLGTLPLEEGVRLLEGGRALLLAAACSAVEPRAYHAHRPAAALAFLQECRLGPTEREGYTLPLIAPVPPELVVGAAADGAAANEPYPRRVTLLLLGSLRLIQEAVRAGAPERILQGVSAGVSANLCEALASLSLDAQGILEVQVSWSRVRPRVPDSLPAQVSFAQGDLAVIGEAGRRLREGSPLRRRRVEGLVVRLEAADSFAPYAGRVTLRADLDGLPTRVRFRLGRPEYARACDAHRDRRRVAVSGTLRSAGRGRTFELVEPSDFEVLATTPAAL